MKSKKVRRISLSLKQIFVHAPMPTLLLAGSFYSRQLFITWLTWYSCSPKTQLLLCSKCLKQCEECSTFHQNVFFTWHWHCLWQALRFSGSWGWGGEELYKVGRANTVAVLCSVFFSVIPGVNHPQMNWGCFGENWSEPPREGLGEKEQLNIIRSQGSSTQVWFFSFYHCTHPWAFTVKKFCGLTLLKTKGHCERNLL